MKKILPMQKQYLISTYNIDASFFSMALSYETTAPWIYGNFIQLKGFKGNSQSYFYETQHDRDTPFFVVQRLGKDLVNQKWNYIIDFIINCIDLNYYILVMINKKHLTIYKDILKEDYFHDVFIYGYDTEQRLFHLSGNFKHGKYSFITCTYEEFLSAYKDSDKEGLYDWLYGIVLFQYRTNEAYKVDTNLTLRIKTLLEHYINSTHMCLHDYSTTTHYDRDQLLFGHDVYHNLIEYLKDEKSNSLDIRTFHLFLNHKNLMLERFKYLITNNYIEANKVDLDSLSEIIKLSEMHRNIALRYNATKELQLKERLINHLYNFIEKENQLYVDIIKIL